MSNNIGNKIKKLRLSKNMSQERFGHKIGVSGKSVSAYENGLCTPSLKVMESISLIYGTPIISNSNREDILNNISIVKDHLEKLEKILTESLSL